ncbi:putative large exoprotein involved in heme utilization or adhesion of ShlA/HecA/FhaA family [Pseudomonas batumici]|uniref:Putative large exoprotein involved in heme utilization or adhesion of ShlA/HecA/FhaA family n=1 Tax=Pseudomonas batumici TaxID=226910 RepID=A0A0C2ICT6_9PSED|nr:putative large exoprotein involved in heme utilization or adhesion of ShlA/HecA/FhaA family [Pseudomonas batumici]
MQAASLDNSGGTLTSRGDLSLTTTGQLTNQNQGLINAAQTLTISSADLNNQGGTLLGSRALTLNALALNNSANGLINSQGGLSISASSLDSSNGGEVSAKGDIGLNLGALTQNGGRLLGSQALSLDLAGGDLDNRNGLLNAQGALSLNHLRDLNNQNGELSSSQSFNLAGRTLDNSGGKLISNNQLGVTANSILNQGGLISGWQGLAVNAGSLDNRNSGTLSSRSGNLGVTLSGALLNGNAGALVSQNNLTVSAASLDNSGGILSSGATQQLTVGGLLNNSAGGSIDSGAALTLNALALTNGGTLSAQQALSFTGTTLDNSGGSLSGKGAVTLDLLGVLSNSNGKLASAGPLLISRSSQINNQGGQLVSQGLLSLLSGGLDNRNRGTVAANGALTLSTGGAVQNSGDGLIYSQNGDVTLNAASLANGKGTVQGQGALNLTIAGDIDNQSGKLIAQNGDLKVSAANLDNRGGTLASVKAALQARIVGVLKNGYDLNNNRQGGITQAQRLDLQAWGGIDNYGGRIAAQTGDAVIATGAGNFDNRNGGVYATGLVKVTGNNFDNSGDNDGQIAGQRIDLNLNGALNNRLGIIESDSTLSVRAASLDNQTGQLRALGTSGKTDFQIGGLFDNRNGKLETANSDLTLGVGSFLNQGGSLLHTGTGTFDTATANLTAAGGSVVTRGSLTLTADSWTNSSVIQAGRLTVNVNTLNQTAGGQLLASTSLIGNGGNWNNDGLIASDGTASLNLSGNYGGNGRYSSLGTLGLSAASLNLGSTGSIAGGDTTTINVGGALNNYGRITSAAGMSVSAGSINNYGTLGSNGNLLLSTPTLLNENGLIFSGGDTALQVNSLTNHTAQLYSLGAVSIGGYGGAAQAAQVSNISGSLESTGQFNINAANFENRTEGFSLGRKLVSGFIAYECIRCWGSYYGANIVVRETFEGQDTDTSAAASLSAGGDFTFRGGNFLNSKSTISAGGNIAIQADYVKNVGAVGGTIERTRSYWTGDIDKDIIIAFADAAFNYNARNNPDFPNIYYINGSGGVSRALAVNSERGGGRDGDHTTVQFVAYTDAVTGETVTPAILSNLRTKPPSQYDPNNLVALPSQLQSFGYGLTGDVEVATNGAGSGRSAVIQAGGNVSISATQDLTNSVIHQDYGFSAGANKIQATQVAGTGAPVVAHINAQLPPNLAQQQVNPLALPGFSLPTGQNGLFRLSGQGGSVRQASQANLGSQNWSMGGAAVSTAQRQQSLPDVQARSFQIGDLSPVAASDRQLTQTTRQVTGSSVGASAINVAAPVDTGSSAIQLPSYTSSASAITQPGAVQVDAAHQSVAVVVPGVTPTLPVIQRDSLTPVIAPVTVAGAATGTPTLARVQGLPDMSVKSNPQKYLVETNPVLTDLKQFMSSDYLLSGLGYNPDTSAKRLGDGFYEQKLIQQAVVARTGQRFIDGQTSNEKLFKYLMDNAISSKQQLNLSVGVTLTSEQVAALTHDIVWMEKQVVNGEEVLVPVLYLAQATNRLGPNGALIQGTDVTLISGANLENSGTLRASNNLSATAGNDLVNTGLIEAGNRLDLLAGNNLVNKSGGIIAGRDVSLTAVNGDVSNERSLSALGSDYFSESNRSYLGDSARIEAANSLTLQAGRDVTNSGSVLQSGGDIAIQAGRDISISATESRDSGLGGMWRSTHSVTQSGATVSAGRDLQMSAGRDLSVIASQIDAKRDIAMAASENLTLSSAADESHSYSKTRTETTQQDHVSQVETSVDAGGNIKLSAGNDMALISSKVSAGDEAYLVAGGKLDVLAAQNSDYSLYDMKKSGSWGSKQTQHDEVTQVTNVGSEIKTGGDLTLQSGSDQHYQAAKLESGKDLTLNSGGGITFEGVKDLHQESHEKTDNDAFWVSSKGSGKTDETLRQTQMAAAGNITIKAVEGLKIDLKQVDQQSVSQTIDAMVKADPKMAWLKDAEKRGDVDWHLVKEIHDSYQYSNSGLGPASQLIIAIVMAAVVGPAVMSAMAGASPGLAVGMAAISTSAATNATTSFINNGGDLGAVFKDVTSSDAIKGYAVSFATAGVAQGLGYSPGNVGFNLQSAQTVALKVTADAAIKTAVYGGSFKDNLGSSAVGTAVSIGGAIGAGKIGDLGGDNGGLEKTLLHAGLGGLLSKAMGGDFRTGAIAGGANELLVGALGDKLLPENLTPGSAEYIRAAENLKAVTQIVAVLGAAASGGDAGIASTVAENATQYNFLSHYSQAERDRARKEFEETKSIDSALKLRRLEGADQRGDDLLAAFHKDPTSVSAADRTELAAYLQVYGYEQALKYGPEAAAASVEMLVKNGPVPVSDYHYAGTTDAKNAYADALRAQQPDLWSQLSWTREQSPNELVYKDAQGYLRINNEQQGLSTIGSPALYAMPGGLGLGIRAAAAVNGSMQAGYGANQVVNGDIWNGIGNIVFGAMGVASLGVPDVRLSSGVRSEVSGGAKDVLGSSTPKWDSAVSKSDGDFGYLSQPEPSKLPAFFDAQGSASGFINNGRIKASDLEMLIPPGVADSFRSSATISDGSKYQYVLGGQKIEIKWHSPDVNAAAKFPGSNSGSGWTAQIKIGSKLLGQDGNLYRKPSNLTHIPVDF